MKNLSTTIAVILLAACCNSLSFGQAATETPTEQAQEKKSFYTVDHYDAEADPAEQLVETLKRAKAENKTVLLQVGGDWCGWCKLMTNYIAETEPVNQLMTEHYLIQKVTFDSENENEAFLGDYPDISGYPHIFVLNADGKMLHSQDTELLEEGRGYSKEAFLKFLNKWKPAEEKADGN